MDCEKLDQHVIDALYGELDELTQAALERHAEGCSRCGPLYAGLEATRAVAVLPLEEPPADLEDRILAAAALQIEAKAPPPASRRGRLVRAMAWSRDRALAPQLAAAAVFVLVIGSSLALFQSKAPSGARSAAPAIAAESAPAAPAATAAVQAAPPSLQPSPVVASDRSAETRNNEGEPPAAPASVAATAVAALPMASATASAAQPRVGGGQVAANEADKANAAKAPPKPPAAKPQNRSYGGTNPRAPAMPLYNDAFK